MALALAGLFGSAPLIASNDLEPSGRATYDPLLDAQGNVCGPVAAGRPPLLQKLIFAQGETKPFKPQPMQAAGGDVPLYDNLGTLSFKVGTRDAKAQAYFDQGMRWAFAFNHAEAQRAFQVAQKADPKLAMAWWGEAFVLGPNINAPMMPEAVAPAMAALAKAVELAPGAPARVTRHRTGRWAFHDLSADLTCREDVDALDAVLSALPGKERAVVRLSLVGSLALADKARLDDVLAGHERVLAALSLWDKACDLAVYVDDDALADLGVSGFAASAVAELAQSARGRGDGAEVSRDALSLAYRLAGGTR